VKLRDEASEVYRRVAERFEATVEQFRKARIELTEVKALLLKLLDATEQQLVVSATEEDGVDGDRQADEDDR